LKGTDHPNFIKITLASSSIIDEELNTPPWHWNQGTPHHHESDRMGISRNNSHNT